MMGSSADLLYHGIVDDGLAAKALRDQCVNEKVQKMIDSTEDLTKM
jgi:hypothetical protein